MLNHIQLHFAAHKIYVTMWVNIMWVNMFYPDMAPDPATWP